MRLQEFASRSFSRENVGHDVFVLDQHVAYIIDDDWGTVVKPTRLPESVYLLICIVMYPALYALHCHGIHVTASLRLCVCHLHSRMDTA